MGRPRAFPPAARAAIAERRPPPRESAARPSSAHHSARSAAPAGAAAAAHAASLDKRGRGRRHLQMGARDGRARRGRAVPACGASSRTACPNERGRGLGSPLLWYAYDGSILGGAGVVGCLDGLRRHPLLGAAAEVSFDQLVLVEASLREVAGWWHGCVKANQPLCTGTLLACACTSSLLCCYACEHEVWGTEYVVLTVSGP